VGDSEFEDASEIADDDSALAHRESLDSDLPLPDLSSLSVSEQQSPAETSASSNDALDSMLFDDPPSEDDGEGEWITPDNVAKVKAREIFSMANGKATAEKHIGVGCMTSDYAMQNVLLHMGLNLVSPEGKRISMVKTWVLRCHACYKCVFIG
jgi:RNA-binding protein NOB1